MAAVASWPATAPESRRLVAALGDEYLASTVEHVAAERGIVMARARDEATVLRDALDPSVDLVVLAIATPGIDTFRVLETIRERSAVSVVVVSRRNTDGDRVLAYELGADDFIPVSCSTRELGARLASVLRRASGTPAGRLEFGSLLIDRAARRATVDERVVDLTRREFDLLVCLANRPRRTFTREELLREAWGSSAAWQSSATVTEHVRRLRRKLAGSFVGLPRISTVHGVGYRFDP